MTKLTTTEDLPFTISASTSYLSLIANEIGSSSVEFTGWYQSERRLATIRFEFVRCICSRMLAFGGEASLGIGEVKRSQWLSELRAHQSKNFPEWPDHQKDIRHFFLRGNDCSVEVLAEGFTWEEKRT